MTIARAYLPPKQAANYGDDVILRGLAWQTPSGREGLDLARRLISGRVTAEEIVRHLEPLGIWWGMTSQYGGLGEYESHAEANWDPVGLLLEEYEESKAHWDAQDPETPPSAWAMGKDRWREEVLKNRREYESGEMWFGGSCAVVLVAKRPKVTVDGREELWDPELHNAPGNFLSGNSYIPEGWSLEIVEVRYVAEDDKPYRSLRAGGIRATAARPGRRTAVREIPMGDSGNPDFQPGIWEMDLSGVSTTGCVAYMIMALGMPMPVAWLTWDKSRRTVEGVWVADYVRGRGIGKELLEQASKAAGGPLVDSGEYTPEGYEWAKKRGLNPRMKKRVPASDMARMIGQMNDALMGGWRCKRLLEAEG